MLDDLYNPFADILNSLALNTLVVDRRFSQQFRFRITHILSSAAPGSVYVDNPDNPVTNPEWLKQARVYTDLINGVDPNNPQPELGSEI